MMIGLGILWENYHLLLFLPLPVCCPACLIRCGCCLSGSRRYARTCASSSSSSTTTATTSRFRYISRQNRSCSLLYSAYDESIIHLSLHTHTVCTLHITEPWDNLFRCSFFYLFGGGKKLAVDLSWRPTNVKVRNSYKPKKMKRWCTAILFYMDEHVIVGSAIAGWRRRSQRGSCGSAASIVTSTRNQKEYTTQRYDATQI